MWGLVVKIDTTSQKYISGEKNISEKKTIVKKIKIFVK